MIFLGTLFLPMALVLALVYLKLVRKQSGCAPIVAFVLGTFPGFGVVELLLYRAGVMLPVVALVGLFLGALIGGAVAAELYRAFLGKSSDLGDGPGLTP